MTTALAANAARMIAERGTTLSLIRIAHAARAEETPWQPGEPTETTYSLDAFVTGVTAQYIDGTTVIASDLMVVASPRATLAGAPVDLVPQMGDLIVIDGQRKEIKRISPAPAAGAPALYRIFVAA